MTNRRSAAGIRVPLTVLSLALACLLAAPSDSPARRLVVDGGLEAHVPDGRWCGPTVQVELRAGSTALFLDTATAVPRMVAALRSILAFECPDARRLELTGRTAGRTVYAAQADLRTGRLEPRPVGSPATPPATPSTVATAQRVLNGLGLDAGPVDGLMGPRTRRALESFQRSAGLRVTGEADPATLRELAATEHSGAEPRGSDTRGRSTTPVESGPRPAEPPAPHPVQQAAADLEVLLDDLDNTADGLARLDAALAALDEAIAAADDLPDDVARDAEGVRLAATPQRRTVAEGLRRDAVSAVMSAGRGWRDAPEVVALADERAGALEDLGLSEGAAKVEAAGLVRAADLLEAGRSVLASELDRLPARWDSLDRLDALTRAVAALPRSLEAAPAYADAVAARREPLLTEIADAVEAEVGRSGRDYNDVPDVVEAGEAAAARFEALDRTAEAERVRAAASARIVALLESSRGDYEATLAQVPVSRDSLADLDARATEFAAYAEVFPEYAAYELATLERLEEVVDGLCRPAIERAGLDDESSRWPILGAEGVWRLSDFVCELDWNGHRVTAARALPPAEGTAARATGAGEGDGRQDGDATDVALAITDADGTMLAFRLVWIDAWDGQPALAAIEAGEPGALRPIGVVDWQDIAFSLLTPPISGEPDAQGITTCDRLAGDPEDPQRVTDGVAEDGMDYYGALEACEVAHAHDPDAPRQRYQLARTLYGLGETDRALAIVLPAADADYAAAAYLAGEILLVGDDFDRALAYYGAANDGGYGPAAEIVADLAVPDMPEMDGMGTLAALPAAEEPTEAEMLAAFVAAIRQRGNCDITRGCTFSALGVSISHRLHDFKKLSCSSLGEGQSLCTYRMEYRCSTNMSSVHNALLQSGCPGPGPHQRQFVKDGDGWSVLVQ